MVARISRVLSLGAAVVGGGCVIASEDADGLDHSEALEPGPCPDCRAEGTASSSQAPQEGGLCCSGTRVPIDATDPRARALGADTFIASIQAGYAGPFAWRRSWGASRASGFDETTELRLSASVQGLEYVDLEPDTSVPACSTPVRCDDALVFDIHVELETADGALAGAGDVHARAWTDQDLAYVYEGLPLRAFTGNLDLGVDAAPVRVGSLVLGIEVTSSGLQGRIQPFIRRVPNLASDAPVSGEWPAPSCFNRGLPVDMDAPLEPGPAGTARELFAGVVNELQAAPAAPATWLDGTMTEVTVELAGDVTEACNDILRGSLGGSVNVQVPVHLATSDGRLDQTLPAWFRIDWSPGGGPPTWRWLSRTDVLDTAALQGLVADYQPDQEQLEANLTANGSAASGMWRVAGQTEEVLDGLQLSW